jgi:hypothetical protein
MDLEKEFQKLMDEVVQKIVDKRNNNQLTVNEADDLIAVIAERRQPRVTDSYEYGPDYDSDRGWQRSSWCGDNG